MPFGSLTTCTQCSYSSLHSVWTFQDKLNSICEKDAYKVQESISQQVGTRPQHLSPASGTHKHEGDPGNSFAQVDKGR